MTSTLNVVVSINSTTVMQTYWTAPFYLEFFCKNSFFLRVRLRERFVNPHLLKQLAVFKIKERLF